MKLKWRTHWLIATAIVGLSAGAFAEDVVVKLPSAKIRAGKGPAYPVVEEVTKGTKLQLVGREETYVKVKSKSNQGYLGENTVASSAGGNIFAGVGEAAEKFSSGSKGGSESAAGKGDLRALDLAHSKGMSTNGLERMVALKKDYQKAQPGDWESFVKEGHVGPAKK